MKIAIVGCGAMGSVYAARLAVAGNTVLVVDTWAEHIHAMTQRGLELNGPDGTQTATVHAFTEVPQEHVDLVVLAVKAAAVPQAATELAPLLGASTTVLTIQNGLGSAEELANILGTANLAVGIASGFGASLVAPGIAHHNAMRAMRFGAYADLAPERVEQVAAVWRSAGFDAQAVADIIAMQWEKLICNVAYSAPCALTGLTVGEVMDHPQMGEVSRQAATEAWSAARALDIAIDVPDPVALVRDFGAGMPAAKPSALLDHEARRPSEIAVINGAIPRESAKAGLLAPVNATLTALAHAREQGW